MKSGFWIFMLMLSIMLYSLTITSCTDENPAVNPGTLAFHMHTLIDSTEVENYGELLTRNDGRRITVSTAQMYISNIKLIKTDGHIVDAPSTILLINQGQEEYEIGNVPAGNYKTVRFDVGLSNATNASTPSASDLSLNQPSMWFGTTAQPDGFVFLNFQGTIDTSSAGNGTNLIPFIYKIGTNQHRVTVTLPDQNFTVASDQLEVVHIEANYAGLLDGLALGVPANLRITTLADNTWTWVTDFEGNIAAMFDYEE
ncbi:MAG: MbnP family protein [Saprospiraceae bacterium]